MMQATVRQAVQAGATNSNGHAHAARDPTSPPYGHIGRRFHRPASRQCRPRESSKAGSNKPRHAREVTTMTDTQPAAPQAPAPSDEQARETAKVAPPTGADWRHAFRDRVKDQLGVRGMVSEYLIPVETNTFWYSLGGVLGISLVLEILTGFVLSLRYVPDAGRAYGITKTLLNEGGWSVVLNFHYWNAYLIFALVMVHMMRVFLSGGYRGAKKGLWQIGVALAGTVFLLSITGEALHWDERGFGVPWHTSEVLEAVGLDKTLHYSHEDLLNIPKATNLLIPYYDLHVAILPILLLALIAMHYYLIKVKGISLPFWHKPTGRRVPFSTHIREWSIYSVFILGAILVVSFFHRSAGPEPQLLPTSEFYGSEEGPGGLGIPGDRGVLGGHDHRRCHQPRHPGRVTRAATARPGNGHRGGPQMGRHVRPRPTPAAHPRHPGGDRRGHRRGRRTPGTGPTPGPARRPEPGRGADPGGDGLRRRPCPAGRRPPTQGMVARDVRGVRLGDDPAGRLHHPPRERPMEGPGQADRRAHRTGGDRAPLPNRLTARHRRPPVPRALAARRVARGRSSVTAPGELATEFAGRNKLTSCSVALCLPKMPSACSGRSHCLGTKRRRP